MNILRRQFIIHLKTQLFKINLYAFEFDLVELEK